MTGVTEIDTGTNIEGLVHLLLSEFYSLWFWYVEGIAFAGPLNFISDIGPSRISWHDTSRIASIMFTFESYALE